MGKWVIVTTLAAVVGSSGPLASTSFADDDAVVRQNKRIRHVCVSSRCGRHAPCGARCRIRCSDDFSCYSLYGAYGPYGGTQYWGSYTYSGWRHNTW